MSRSTWFALGTRSWAPALGSAVLGLAVLGCRAPDAAPGPRVTVDDLILTDELVFARGPRDNHHATVAVLPGDRVPDAGVPAAWVAWNDGNFGVEAYGRATAFDAAGTRAAPVVRLADGAPLGKPDVVASADGRVFALGDTDAGIEVERLDGDPSAATVLAASGAVRSASSPDLAVGADGAMVAAWYEPAGEVGRVRAVSVDAALQPTDVIPPVIAEMDNPGVVTVDVEIDPDGGVLIAYTHQRVGDVPSDLRLRRYLDGALLWEVVLDVAVDGEEPRRPTVTVASDGTIVVGWRFRAERLPAPSRIRAAVLRLDGRLVAPAFGIGRDENLDDLVVAAVGPGAAWAVWTRVLDDALGLGSIVGGLLSVPDGEWIVAPFVLSDPDGGLSSRPHTAATAWGEDGYGVAVIWEDGEVLREVKGRMVVLPAEVVP